MAKITVYHVEDHHGWPLDFDLDQLLARIRRSAYHFWLAERRMPAAVVMSNQLATQVSGEDVDFFKIDGISFYGRIDLDETTWVPIIGRDAGLDPLWLFI